MSYDELPSYSYGEAGTGALEHRQCTLHANFTLDCSFEAFYDQYGLALNTGILCAAAQIVFTVLFKALPWTQRHPTFLAHQVVAFPLMIILSWMGLAAWLFPAEDALAANAAGTYGRLHYPVEAGRQISLLILGFQLFWDVPMTFTSAMYDPVMLVHHVGMLGCAVVSFMPYVQYYVPFFGGAIELSSVPLVIIDIFHPKRYQDVADSNPISAQANFFMRVIFLLSYLAIRCIWFPVVVFTEVLPDFLGELSSAANVSAAAAPIIGMLFILPLMFLQFYWGHLLIRQAIKALSAPPEMADDRVAKPTEMV